MRVQPRIMQAVDDAQLSTLRGNTHPLALARFDRGAAPASLPLDRMLLVLKRSPEQDAALSGLLDEQQDKSSPNYHKWLTPEEFGKRFGPADADVQTVTSWLQTHGFQVKQVSKGRSVIEFSGTAAMVQEAFHTVIHQYSVSGEAHFANASDPQMPGALMPVVSGVWTLHNFFKKPMLRISKEHFPLVYPAGSSKPLATSSKGTHFLSPGDFSLVYGINPVYQAGINGTGVNIAVLGRSNFNLGDIYDFRSALGMPGPNVSVSLNGPDPGNLGGGEEAEAVLDATWSGAIAPGASVLFVLSASTDTTDGVDLSELYAIDNNLAEVMTESFGSCEAGATSTEMAGLSALAQQAAAQGITYVVSSGDTGSAGCDHLSETTAAGPVSVSAVASTPYNVAVGGTIFNENGQSTYWSSSTSTPVTALKYIPENVWNESCTSATCGNSANIAAGGGGPSSSVPKPAWQSGPNLHIPNDGFRDVPDVSLTAALHDPYLLCLAGSCSQRGFLIGIGGTSASAPSFAGIMALVNQKMRQVEQNPNARIGLANYVLYRLANAETLSQCNASSSTAPPASSCPFNDVTKGNNAVPGETSYGGSNPQFSAVAGYDLATGLGSVQVNNLVNAWSSVTFNSTTTTLALTPAPTNVVHGTAVQVNIAVAPGSGSAKPTGDVSLIGAALLRSQGVTVFHLANGTATGTTNSLP
ncbi:MAG: peptidase S53, partial [Acidobacteria bacterium]